MLDLRHLHSPPALVFITPSRAYFIHLKNLKLCKTDLLEARSIPEERPVLAGSAFTTEPKRARISFVDCRGQILELLIAGGKSHWERAEARGRVEAAQNEGKPVCASPACVHLSPTTPCVPQ